MPEAQDPGAATGDPAAGEAEGEVIAPNVDEIVSKVRESMGLKEGQRIDRLIDKRVEGAVRSSFGLEEGQTAMDAIKGVIADSTKASDPAPAKPAKGEDANAQLRADLEAVKAVTTDLTAAKDKAETSAANERRRGLIRDALGEFDLNANVKGIVTRGFLEGVEADLQVASDGENLEVKGSGGDTQPFGAYLKDYFTSNKGLLNTPRFSGTGAKGGNGAPPPSDIPQGSEKADVKARAKAWADSPEAAEAVIDKRTAELEAKFPGAF